MALTGLIPKAELVRKHFPAEGGSGSIGVAAQAGTITGAVQIQPFEMRTFLIV
jgi:hypothetical protein